MAEWGGGEGREERREGKRNKRALYRENILKRNLSASTSNCVQCYRPQEWPIPIQRTFSFSFSFFFTIIMSSCFIECNIVPPDRSQTLPTD